MSLSYKRFFKLKRVAKGNGIITITSNESDDYLSKKKNNRCCMYTKSN